MMNYTAISRLFFAYKPAKKAFICTVLLKKKDVVD